MPYNTGMIQKRITGPDGKETVILIPQDERESRILAGEVKASGEQMPDDFEAFMHGEEDGDIFDEPDDVSFDENT